MLEQGTVKWVHARSGLTGIVLDDGSHVLVEPLQAGGAPVGARLRGEMRRFGEVTLSVQGSDTPWTGFVLGYDLSEEAVSLAMR